MTTQMKKYEGMNFGEWEVVSNDDVRDDDYEYVEMEIEDLLDEGGYTSEEKDAWFCQHMAVNMHLMVSKETIEFVYTVIKDIKSDDRLKNLNAVVFLGLKPKGRGDQYHPLEESQFAKLCETCFDNDVPFGFDSCSAPRFEKFIRESDMSEETKKSLISISESCESGLFSAYVNVRGEYFPCSFCEGEGEWKEGVSVLECDNFLNDVWYNHRVKLWRSDLIKSSCEGCRKCLVFPEIN